VVAAYSEVLQAGQFPQWLYNSLSHEIETEEENERTHDHDGNDANDLLPNDHDDCRGDGQHHTRNSTIASTPHEQDRIRKDKIVLEYGQQVFHAFSSLHYDLLEYCHRDQKQS